MGNYGIRVSQKGYDVKTCADKNLSWSSSFQTLKIFSTYAVTSTIPVTGVNTITITHGLGYIAPYIVVYNGSTTIGQSNSYFFADSQLIALYTRGYTNTIEIDVDEFFDFLASATGATVYFTVYVFLDDFRTVAERNIDTGADTVGSLSSNYGLRVSKNGYDVKTCTSDQLAFSSSFFNQIIHKKGIVTSLPVSHNLGYIPAHLTFMKFSGNAYIENYPFFGTDSTTLDSTGISVGDSVYYIIFKNSIS